MVLQKSMSMESESDGNYKFNFRTFSLDYASSNRQRQWEGGHEGLPKMGRNSQAGISRVMVEDQKQSNVKILDPGSKFVHRWNEYFVISCWISLFVDPLFFYLPVISNDICITIEKNVAIMVTTIRTIIDAFYVFHMGLQFRTGFLARSSQVFGKGDLVLDIAQIARKYMRKNFWMDFFSVLPLPQFFIWIVIPMVKGPTADNTKNAIRFIVLFQYIPRLLRIYPLTSKMVKNTGLVTETAWAGAAYNLVLFMLASHAIGACWYLLAVEREDTCWRKQCNLDNATSTFLKCKLDYLDCGSQHNDLAWARSVWLNSTQIGQICSGSGDSSVFNFGIYGDALSNNIITTDNFFTKYWYCLWWGLRNLSSLGQNLFTSTYVGEIIFAIIIAIVGLVLFALLIGNMQTYLQSLTVRLEEMRVKRRDTEQWMKHRQLPSNLRNRVRRYEQQKWVANRGVDEEALFESLPLDLRRDIKRHLCLDLVRRVPLFNKMDEMLLDAICERLKSTLSTEGTFIVREGDPVNEMLFILRGSLESITTDGGRTGFLNYSVLGQGDFCGEELLSWALLPKSRNLPSSTRTVKALMEVEAFALSAEDLKYVAGQFRRLHSKQLQHTFRYYSQQWRTWSALYIQSAWRRFLRKKLADLQLQARYLNWQEPYSVSQKSGTISLGATFLASKFAVNAMRGVQRLRTTRAAEMSAKLAKLTKPSEPNFAAEFDE
ncbi:hypothetical protein O6H91_05G069600 [Diphasiastrum complanatum]|uniref:Uncharacterized protein n=1 Tax=Diphasiastrum complanatum TaxID=34168 RepID=A0ACC2DPL2_DIPCM|nr:hypothetical protein O6H91_Y339000 [Diphasiastrum complanatum]KAJ7298974.1 hypothetical protein O6H91_Y339000 [Diphasiastrum complanatum]KAJ7298975.1 hypothetical protein O6H91_Y339000 [Diphasiastrum complanatum]KAJ7556120.1 hypothetical protein O6H91_05G069600 [Diphasiastrum complanatum]